MLKLLKSFAVNSFKIPLACFDIANDLRLNTIFNYFLVTSWFMYSSGVSVERSVEYASLMSLMAAFAYLLNRYTDYSYDVIVDRGLKKAPRWLYLVLSITFLCVCCYFIFRTPLYFLPFVFGGAFGVLYSVKTFFKYPIKNYLITKNLFAAGAKYVIVLWGALLFLPPTESLFIRSLSMLCIYYIYEILWDIRDMESDKVGHVSTIANVFGKAYAISLSLAVLFVSFAVQFPYVNHTDHFFIKYSTVLFFIISFLFIKKVRWYHMTTYAHLTLNLVFISSAIPEYIGYFFSALGWKFFFLYMQYFANVV